MFLTFVKSRRKISGYPLLSRLDRGSGKEDFPMEEKPRQRRRDKQTVSLPSRLLMLAREAEKRAAQMPPCEERDDLFEKGADCKDSRRTRFVAKPAEDAGIRHCARNDFRN
jgi:hypothetical protein